MTLIDQEVVAGPAPERTVLPPRHELAAQAKATWTSWKETTRYELALTLVKMKMAYNASIREISDETTIPRSTVHKLITWHYAGYPECGPFSKPPVEHQPEEDEPQERDDEPQEGEGRQPGQGQRALSAKDRQIVSLTQTNRDQAEHIAELESARAEPVPVTLVEGKRSKEEIRAWVVAHIASKKDFAWLRVELDEDYDNFPDDDKEDADADAGDDGDADTDADDNADAGGEDTGNNDAGKDEVQASADEMKEKFEQLDAVEADDLSIPKFLQQKPTLEE
jgi:hypothetical protein